MPNKKTKNSNESEVKTRSSSEPKSSGDVDGKMTRRKRKRTADEESKVHTSNEDANEKLEQPAFTLATLGLQRVGTAPPPKPKVQSGAVQLLNARGMPARIRKRNPFFFDDNIINDDKPLRMSLSPKKAKITAASTAAAALPTKNGAATGTTAASVRATPGSSGNSLKTTTKPQINPPKILQKRRGVISRYMRTGNEPILRKKDKGQQQKTTNKGAAELMPAEAEIKTVVATATTSKTLTAAADTKTAATATATASITNKKAPKLNSSMPKNRRQTHKQLMKTVKKKYTKINKNEENLDQDQDQDKSTSTLTKISQDNESKALAVKMMGQSIGLCLRNLLKLPKAHKWAIAEWFYSFIDQPLFESGQDFSRHLETFFPGLKTNHLTKLEWRYIRRKLGKPRRFSQAFLDNERQELKRRRNMIRALQMRKPGELTNFEIYDMPNKIPMSLPVGTKVTARLRLPQDGIFSGSVDAYDSLSATYRVTFERPGLGTHSIPDFEIVSENFNEMLPLHTFTKDFRPNLLTVFNNCANSGEQSTKSNNNNIKNARQILNIKLKKVDPLLSGQDNIDNNPINMSAISHHYYPFQLLRNILRLRQLITLKYDKVQRLKVMNDEAELGLSIRATAYRVITKEDGTSIMGGEFRRRYASNIISIEKLNANIMLLMNEVQVFSTDLIHDPHLRAIVQPTYLRQECRERANNTVMRFQESREVKNQNLLQLIKNLSTLLIVLSRAGRKDIDINEIHKMMHTCLQEIQSDLTSEKSLEIFRTHVEMRTKAIFSHMQRSMSQQNVKPKKMFKDSEVENVKCEKNGEIIVEKQMKDDVDENDNRDEQFQKKDQCNEDDDETVKMENKNTVQQHNENMIDEKRDISENGSGSLLSAEEMLGKVEENTDNMIKQEEGKDMDNEDKNTNKNKKISNLEDTEEQENIFEINEINSVKKNIVVNQENIIESQTEMKVKNNEEKLSYKVDEAAVNKEEVEKGNVKDEENIQPQQERLQQKQADTFEQLPQHEQGQPQQQEGNNEQELNQQEQQAQQQELKQEQEYEEDDIIEEYVEYLQDSSDNEANEEDDHESYFIMIDNSLDVDSSDIIIEDVEADD